ncbi:MAG: transcription termination factor NusA [Treponemataceae bacterium]
MASDMAEAIRQLTQEKGISEELVLKTIENMLKAAYKRTFGTNENAVVKFNEDNTDVSIYSRKVIVDGVYDPVIEIELEEALELSPDCEEGDEIDILVDPKDFDRGSIQTGKQTAQQSLRDIQKDTLHSEYADKIGEIIIGYYQRERNGNVYVDLGKVEGILPKKFQSPREVYNKDDRIKALIVDVKKTSLGLQVVLSRTDADFVRRIIELEVPEVYDKTIEIYKIVREAGYRTKLAVYTNREDVDPVGACVGLKGSRIQTIIRELDGEKIDILRYDPNPKVFIKNVLAPAEVTDVIILDEEKKQALAVVAESQFSLAIGKQGLNVRLANRLSDWSIDVKTDEQYDEIDEITAQSRQAAHDLFSSNDESILLEQLDSVDEAVVALLKEHNIVSINDFLDAQDNDALSAIEGLSEQQIESISVAINNAQEMIDDGDSAEEFTDADNQSEEEQSDSGDEEEVYECPECGSSITIDMVNCPNCGIGLSFEYEE